ncbi:MAG: hypothetical protein J6V55_06060 [Alistipes sp.]|nr:hypothetical protein [Alistipes sp.]
MRLSKIFIATIALVAFVAPTKVTAQEHKHVEVTTVYSPDLAQASKLVAPASVAEDSDLQPEIEYTINTDIWQIELDDHYFDPARASYWDYDRPVKNYVKAGFGTPGNSDFKFRYTTQNSRVGYFSVGFNHDGNFSKRENMDMLMRKLGESFDMRNGVSLVAGTFLGSQMLEVDTKINLDTYNRYAESVAKASRLNFTDLGVKVTYGDNFSNLNRLNFGIDVHGGYWAHETPAVENVTNPLSQFNAGGSLRFARNFYKDTFGLKIGGDMYQSLYTTYNNLRISVEGEYSRDFGFVSLESALGYMFDKVQGAEKPANILMPRAKALFNLGLNYLTPFIEINTTVSQNSSAGLYNMNPYIDYNVAQDAMLAMPNSRSYDLSTGILGSVLNSHLTYRLYVGSKMMRDCVVWYVTNNGNFGIATADNKRTFVGAELGYNPLGGLMLTAKVDAHKDETDSKYVFDAPKFTAEFMAEYTIKRFRVYCSANMMGAREWSRELDAEGNSVYEPFKSDSTIDLRAGMSLRATSKWKVYVDGYNLLNARIYDFAYYYRNGMGVVAGVEIDF